MEGAKNSSEMIFTDILTEFDEETSLYVTNQSFPAPAPWISDHEELHPIPSPLFLAETGHATAAASPESSLNFSSAFSSPSCSSDEELDGLKRKSIEGSQEEKITKKRRRRLQEDQAATVEEGRNKPRMRRGSATDPQSVYARKRRERINQRLKILQNLVPNGTKVDISTMLEQAIEYVKFMQLQIKLLSSDEHWMYAPIAFNGCMSNMDLNSASFHAI